MFFKFSHWSIHCLGNLLVLCFGEGFSELDSKDWPRNWVNLGWVVSCCTRLVIWHNWWENPPTFSWENPPNYDDDFPISYVKLPEGCHLWCVIALWEGIQNKATKECRVSIGLVMDFWGQICLNCCLRLHGGGSLFKFLLWFDYGSWSPRRILHVLYVLDCPAEHFQWRFSSHSYGSLFALCLLVDFYC